MMMMMIVVVMVIKILEIPSTQQKITDVKQLTNISDVRLLSDVLDDECSCALFVHWNICAQIVIRIFVHERLTNILDVSVRSVCAQTVDEYFRRPFAVHLCTNG